ncbi:MAG: hypothetical protein ACI8VT_001845 [Saprospiraceae bacterium]
MKLGLFDRLKIAIIIAVRYINRAAIERWSESTFHRRYRAGDSMPELVPAKIQFGFPELPAALQVPKKIPRESKLGLLYMLPYYFLAGGLFKLLFKIPIKRGTNWLPTLKVNEAFPKNEEGWKNVNDDNEFALLRLQGPNPFLLKHTGNEHFEVDYSPYFKNIFDPVKCIFKIEGDRFVVESITVGKETHLPGDKGWERAKLLANALDARYCVFTRHLLDTHMLIGEAYALAAFALAPDHPLRTFFQLFTYSSLVVNDFAYKLLITPASYFIQSKFVSAEDCMILFQNSMDAFSLNDLIVPMDVSRRGIDKIPNHPYVADALKVWDVFQKFSQQYTDDLYADDASVIADASLQNWYKTLASLLPNQDITDAPLDSRQGLIDVICCLLYNNVSHEVCGDFSVFGQSANPDHKKIVNFERLKTGDESTDPDLADVFLFDQGAFAGRFNNGGNNLLTLPIDKLAKHDIKLRTAVKHFQADLLALERELKEINKSRKFPFLRMLPGKWEASISF